MKRFALFIAVFTAMTTVGTAWEREDKTEPKVRLEIDLVDGSHITGIPRIQSVPVQSSYAKMDIALKEIRSIKFDANHETASVDLIKGDKIKGVISLAPIKLETEIGEVAVDIEHIRELRVVAGGTGIASNPSITKHGAEDNKEPKVRLELDLVDGSHVIGTPSIKSVPVQTSYAKMDIPLKEIRTIKIDADHETASLDLMNGDKVKGVISLAPIKLETAFGMVSVGIEHVRELRVVLAGGVLPEALREGLVLHYSFDRDEGGKVTDKSDKRHDGVVRGAKWMPNGKVGGAYEFNGKGDYIDTKANFSGMREMTVCGWSYFTETPADSSIITQYGGQPSDNVWALFSAANGKGAEVNFCPASGGDYNFYGNNYEMRKWKHLCVTYSAGKALTLYENGVPVNSVAIPNSPLRSVDNTAKVAASQGLTGYWGSGLIDEVMIFERALTGDEIKQIYDQQK